MVKIDAACLREALDRAIEKIADNTFSSAIRAFGNFGMGDGIETTVNRSNSNKKEYSGNDAKKIPSQKPTGYKAGGVILEALWDRRWVSSLNISLYMEPLCQHTIMEVIKVDEKFSGHAERFIKSTGNDQFAAALITASAAWERARFKGIEYDVNCVYSRTFVELRMIRSQKKWTKSQMKKTDDPHTEKQLSICLDNLDSGENYCLGILATPIAKAMIKGDKETVNKFVQIWSKPKPEEAKKPFPKYKKAKRSNAWVEDSYTLGIAWVAPNWIAHMLWMMQGKAVSYYLGYGTNGFDNIKEQIEEKQGLHRLMPDSKRLRKSDVEKWKFVAQKTI